MKKKDSKKAWQKPSIKDLKIKRTLGAQNSPGPDAQQRWKNANSVS